MVRQGTERGFALIATISVMVLLVMIALAMLSLSTIELRSSQNGRAMAEARANARLALMLAIGELQRQAGPDTAASATSDILSTTQSPVKKAHLTGIWESWDYNPNSSSPLNYDSEKEDRFRGWLVSSPKPSNSIDFANTAWSGDTIELIGEGSLGKGVSDDSKVFAGLVPISPDGQAVGAYAWHVADEAVKARINHYRDPNKNKTLSQKLALLAGHRPNTSVMEVQTGSGETTSLDYLPSDQGNEAFQLVEKAAHKIIDLNQVDLLDGGIPGGIKPFRHHVTPYSLGLLTDVRHGGLKQDLSSIFEMSSSSTDIRLPAEFEDQRLYQSTTGITGVSDPYWSNLSSYYNCFKVLENVNTNPLFAQSPTQQLTLDENNAGPPQTFFPGPVIQKVEMMFSIVIRDTHPGATGNMRDAESRNYPFLGHLVFTPIVTLHNPYNVNISFDKMKVTMDNIPVSFRIYLDGQPINTRLLNLSYYFFQNHKNGRSKTDFTIRIADWKNWGKTDYSNINGPTVMKPGQSLVCSPYLDPSYTWTNTKAQYLGDVFFNEDKGRKAKPGYYGRCFGFDSDVIRPKFTPDGANNIQTPTPPRPNNRYLPYFALKDANADGVPDGQLRVECAIRQPVTGTTSSGIDDSRFDVRAQVTVAGEDYDYGGLRFGLGADDGNPNADLFADGIAPEVYSTGTFTAGSAYVPDEDPISEHVAAQTFCVFSAYARTTSGGVYDNGGRIAAGAGSALRDGRLAGMPYLFHNPARPLALMDLSKEKPGAHSHELNVQPFYNLGQVEDYFNLDALNRTSLLTGNTTQRGIKSGSYLELPLGPMQTIADFRRSNVLASPYLPNYVQPIGNSRITPVFSTSKVKMAAGEVADYALLDHGVLANHALYDRFYFSTFATEIGLTQADSDDPAEVFERFMNGDAPLLSQAYQPYLPNGETVATAKSKLFSGGKPKDDAYSKAAAYQMVKGPFNVNSTSVQAWKAMLAAASKEEVMTLWAKNAEIQKHTASGAPVMPMALINGGMVSGDVIFEKIDNALTNDWNGYRDLDTTELDELATNIVDQVRKRGPFLSMSEFVNRRIGPDSELTRMGALESAIAAAGINDEAFLDQVQLAAADITDADLYSYKTPLASVGNPAAGAPGWVSQGDLMRLLEPAATVRADTFVIRVCGEAWDAKANVTARAYAEAVVQRLPEYVDPADSEFVNVHSNTGASPTNKSFGRRFSIVSFRWLKRNEI